MKENESNEENEIRKMKERIKYNNENNNKTMKMSIKKENNNMKEEMKKKPVIIVMKSVMIMKISKIINDEKIM